MKKHHSLCLWRLLYCIGILHRTAFALVFRDCWLLFGTLDDIGYSHSMNLGRLQINQYLRHTYKDHTFESIAYPGVFFMEEEARAVLVNQTIAEGCNLVFSTSAGLMDEFAYALEFPNISFVRASGAVFQDKLPNNLAENVLDWFHAGFVSGAVAAAVSNTCAGFINAFEHRWSTWGHAMGFALGYQRVKPNLPLYIVTMDGYFNPDAEVMAAQQLVEQKNCDVIARHTDPNDVDKYVYRLGGKVLSMARYVDMSTFVGDTVFTSQVWNAFEILVPFLEDSFLTLLDGRAGNFTNVTNGIIDGWGTMELSPFTSAVNQTLARSVADAAWHHINTTNPLCGQKWRTTREPIEANSEECLRYETMELPQSYLDLPTTVTYYDSFVDGGAVCGDGGKLFKYTSDLSVICIRCPPNTYQSSSSRASETCVPCPPGTSASEGSKQCTAIANNIVMITTVACTSCIVMLFMILLLLRASGRRDNQFAPKQAHKDPIAVIFTDIQASTTLWAHIPEEMAKAVDAHNMLLRGIIRKHKGYEVKTIGDAFMVVHSDISKAVLIATEIQQVLYKYDWGTAKIDQVYLDLANKKKTEKANGGATGADFHAACWNGLRVRVGVAYGTCDGQKDPVTGGWDYYGTTVNTSARVESVAHGGQVLLTAPAYQALLMSGNTGSQRSTRIFAQAATSCQEVVSNGVRARIVSESARANARLGISNILTHGAVFLRGLSERVGLVEVVTVGFEDRSFPSLRIDNDEPEPGEPNQIEGESMSCDMTNSSLDGTELLALTPENRMDRLMKLSMRAAGVRRCDAMLVQSTWSIYHSLKAVLSLNSMEERGKILEQLIRKWHLSCPKLDRRVLDEVGSDTPELLMLSIRAATVVLAGRRRTFLAFDSTLPTEIGVLADIQEERKEHDSDFRDGTDDTTSDNLW